MGKIPSTPKNTRTVLTGTNRFTPYRQTQTRRNVLATPRLPVPSVKRKKKKRKKEAACTDEPDVVYHELCNKCWRSYRLSPFFDFDLKNKLRRYQVLLGTFVETESKSQVVVVVSEEYADKAIIQERSINGEQRIVQIQLKRKLNEGHATVVLTAILCANSEMPSLLCGTEQLPSNLTHFPLMLVKGPVGLTKHLIAWLEQSFDCIIHPISFSPVELRWMLALWVGKVAVTSKKMPPVLLEYETPADVTGLKRIKLMIDAADCKKLWFSIYKKEDDPSVQVSQVQAFNDALETHFYAHFKISLNQLTLCKVGTVAMYASCGGIVKVFLDDCVEEMLNHILDLIKERTLFT